MKKTGWRSVAYVLDKLMNNINPEDFSMVEVEVILKIVERGEGGEVNGV